MSASKHQFAASLRGLRILAVFGILLSPSWCQVATIGQLTGGYVFDPSVPSIRAVMGTPEVHIWADRSSALNWPVLLRMAGQHWPLTETMSI